jgi:hypothetical protein
MRPDSCVDALGRDAPWPERPGSRPRRSPAEEQGLVVHEAQSMAIRVEAVEGALLPGSNLDGRSDVSPGSYRSLLDLVEFTNSEVQVHGIGGELPTALDRPVDEGKDRSPDVEVQTSRDGVICIRVEHPLVEGATGGDVR